MDRATRIETLRTAAARIGEICADTPGAPLQAYPGRDVLDLVCHVLTIHEWVIVIVGDGLTERPATRTEYDRTMRGVVDCYHATWRRLADLLERSDPDTPVWTFGADRTVGFWQARMAHETSLHRWDAERAIDDDPGPIPSEVAVSALGEGLHIHFERLLRRTEIGGQGDRVVVRCTDADAAWTVTLRAEGVEVVDGDPDGDPDGALEGTASDLWLAFAGRVPMATVAASATRAVKLVEAAIAALPPAL